MQKEVVVFYGQSGSGVHGHVYFFIDIHTSESIDRLAQHKKEPLSRFLFISIHYSQAGTMVPLYFSAMNFLTDSD